MEGLGKVVELSISLPAAPKKVVVPEFEVSTPVAPTSEDVAILRHAQHLVGQIRFDATALPIADLRYRSQGDGIVLLVDMLVPDRDSPRGDERIHVWRMVLCPWEVLRANGAEYLVRFTREQIASTLAHEVDECFAFRGERVFDPHAPLTNVVEVVQVE